MSGAPSLFDNLGDIKSRHPKVFESGGIISPTITPNLPIPFQIRRNENSSTPSP